MTPVEALQAALDIEHQVVYGYGVLAAHLPAATGVSRAACLARLRAHQRLRDRLTELVGATGAVPRQAAPAYAVPPMSASGSDLLELGRMLEEAVAGAMWDLVSASDAGTEPRRLGVSSLTDAAGWIARFSGVGTAPPALPGQPVASQPSTSSSSSSSPSITPSGSTS